MATDQAHYLATLHDEGHAINARLYRNDPANPTFVASGKGPCERSAIADAIGRPHAQFSCAQDELGAVIACARRKRFALSVTRRGLRCQGFR